MKVENAFVHLGAFSPFRTPVFVTTTWFFGTVSDCLRGALSPFVRFSAFRTALLFKK